MARAVALWALKAPLRGVAASAVLAVALAGCAEVSVGAGGPAQRTPELESPLGSYLAGRYARASRDTGAAVGFFEAALAEDPGNDTLRHRTFTLLLADGRMERALQLAETLVQDPRTAMMPELLLAAREVRAERHEAALERLGEPDDRGFGALLKPLFRAWIAAERGDAIAAEAHLETLSEHEAFVPFRDFHAALILDRMGAVGPADEAYRRFRQENGVSVAAALAHGSLLRRDGRDDEAAAVYAEALERVPENPVMLSAARALREGQRAEPYIENARQGIAEALFGAAGALARERGGDAARIYTHLALYLRPDFDSALVLLGEILDLDRRWGEAIEAYRRVPENSPYFWEARIRVATDLNRMDRVDEAIAELDRVVGARDDSDTSATVALADLLRARERYDDAAVAYDRAIARLAAPEERHWALYYARGISHERSGEWDRAEADFRVALELKPDHPLVLNYLGYSWVEQGRHLDRALQMIEKAVAQRPSDGYIVDSLGWALYRLKDYEGAVAQLERAVELKPQDPVINDHLGDAYWRVGRRLEARFQWRHALGLEPEADEVPKIEAKLENGLAGIASADASR